MSRFRRDDTYPFEFETTLNVRDFGAVGDGRADDTRPFATCIGSLGGNGGTVVVPTGNYRIDPDYSIRLIDNLVLQFESGASVEAFPVASSQSAVIRGTQVKNIVIRGGTVVGERLRHSGAKGEWGMGIDLRGCDNVQLLGITARDCWGDGIYIGASNGRECSAITLTRCFGHGNRRQGLSITGCIIALIEQCEFSATHGTSPQAGIDIEPNGKAQVRDVRIVRCRALHNEGPGIALSGRGVSGITLDGNTVSMNKREGIFVARAVGSVLRGNTIEKNGRSGVLVGYGAALTRVVGNSIGNNSQSFRGWFDNVFLDSGATDTFIEDNEFTTPGVSTDASRSDVRVNSRDCSRTHISANRFRPHHGTSGGVYDNGTGTVVSGGIVQRECNPALIREAAARTMQSSRPGNTAG